jgi:enoyl-CoA hydratase/carnithine racemase
MSELINVERRDHGATWVTLNRPKALNALSRALNEELRGIAADLAADRSVRAVVITGSGPKSFSAGADLCERKGVTAAETGPYVNAISGAINAVASIPKPTLALVNGYAFGGGMELSLACDFRIASDNATFGLTEVRLGIMPGAGGTQRLPRLIGVSRAKELILLGRRIGADRALEYGLVMRVVPIEELYAAADELLGELAGCAPVSLGKAKEAIERGIEVDMSAGLAIERECYDVTLYTEDRNEGLRAFADKRPPEFKGV